MNSFFNVLHPTFDALSAHVDLSETAAARTRVGRHVAACAQCRQATDEIRALGQAARDADDVSAPPGLWARIEEGKAAQPSREAPPPPATPWDEVPALRPTRHWPVPSRTARRWGVGVAIAAAAAVVGVLAWPTGETLQASAVSRLTFSPGRPVPGGFVTIRYRPAEWLAGQPRLLLLGRLQAPYQQDLWWMRPQLADSLATLRRGNDGIYEGRFQLPPTFLTGIMTVTDSVGENVDADGWYPWHIIGGSKDGSPSFAALLMAVQSRDTRYEGSGDARQRQPVNPADSLRRYFPAHPAGWAFSEDYGKEKGISSLLRFFESAERKYQSWDQKLWPIKNLDAEKMVSMLVFARRIEEPQEVAKWSHRFVREHPAHPLALNALADVLHDVELREPKSLADSIRPWFPVMDTLYQRNPKGLATEHSFTMGSVLTLATRYGDEATKAKWRSRRASAGNSPPSDSTLRNMSRRGVDSMRTQLTGECRLPSGRYPLAAGPARWRQDCRDSVRVTLTTAARWHLFNGEPRVALALADSGLRLSGMSPDCFAQGSRAGRIRARAHLALGDTASAERAFVAAATPRTRQEWTDSVRVALGSRFNQARWDAAMDSSAHIAKQCAGVRSLEWEARRATMKRLGR